MIYAGKFNQKMALSPQKKGIILKSLVTINLGPVNETILHLSSGGYVVFWGFLMGFSGIAFYGLFMFTFSNCCLELHFGGTTILFLNLSPPFVPFMSCREPRGTGKIR